MDIHRIPGSDGEWVKWIYTEYQVVMGSGLDGHRIFGRDGNLGSGLTFVFLFELYDV